MYAKYLKRLLDFLLSLILIILLSPLLILLSILGFIFMSGNPFFVQLRHGKNEKIFKLIKFRTMSNKKDKNGQLLPDVDRLNSYGKFLRSTSLDEIPEIFNIFIGNMSFVGPRPQLIRDFTFMTDKEKTRYKVLPGLTGLAQINGRNNIGWDKKFEYDIKYIEEISFKNDFIIALNTFFKVLKKSDVNREGTSSDLDYGDWLLERNLVSLSDYKKNIAEAIKIEEEYKC